MVGYPYFYMPGILYFHAVDQLPGHIGKRFSGKSVWIFLLMAAVYAIFRIPDLSLPLFWDELGVYGRGILYMTDHGPGMLPSSLPPELSRGHPLFFYFFFALGGWLTNFSLEVLHTMALLVTLGVFASVWFAGRILAGEWYGLAGALLLMFMPNIYAQSTLILPEMMLALLTFLALFFFYQKNFKWYLIMAGLALLTKESALVIPLATAFFALLTIARRKWTDLGIALSPVLIFALFLLIQRIQNGWYFFPYHVELVSLKPEDIFSKTGRITSLLFIEQGRWAFSILLLMGGITGAVRWIRYQARPSAFFLLCSIYFLGFLSFSALNFYMDRYYLSFFPVLGIFAVWSLREINLLIIELSPKPVRKLFPVAFSMVLLIAVTGTLLNNFSEPEFRYDVDISFKSSLDVQKEATRYLETIVKDEEPFFANFPLYNCFLDPRYGFTTSERPFAPTVVYSDTLRIVAIIQPPLDAAFTIKIAPEKEIKRFENGYAKAVIYDLTR